MEQKTSLLKFSLFSQELGRIPYISSKNATSLVNIPYSTVTVTNTKLKILTITNVFPECCL
jgi:hypothetical protein